jgi:hypothetical protein
LQDEQFLNLFPTNFVLYGLTNSSVNIAGLFKQKDALLEVENTQTVTFLATAEFSVFLIISPQFALPNPLWLLETDNVTQGRNPVGS